MLMAPWFDEPLSVAGRVDCKGAALKPILALMWTEICVPYRTLQFT